MAVQIKKQMKYVNAHLSRRRIKARIKKQMLATSPSSSDYYSTSVQLQSMLVVTHNYLTP